MMSTMFRTPLQRHDLTWRRNQHPPIPVHRNSYDTESGQVFTETEIVFRRRPNIDWISELKTPSIIPKSRPNDIGSRSLFDIARTKCVKESREFTTDHFEHIPWSIAKHLWGEITAIHSESFWAWRNMASVYSESDEFGQPAYRYHIEIKQPTLPTREYYVGLTMPECRWLSALRISPRDLSLPDLVAIASITNLTVLDLSDGQRILENRVANFDERVFRSWADLASAGKAFSYLRVLLLGWQDAVSEWIFKYLHHFPSLCLIVTTDCKGMHQKNRAEWESIAHAHGWEAQHAKKSVKNLRPLLDDSRFYTAAVSNCYYESFRQVRETNKIVGEKSDIRPLVECRLGLPRSWTHIIDEFPGTRTVWLEKTIVSQPGTKAGSVHSKRVREVVSASPTSSLSPPHKRMQNRPQMRQRAAEESAANLLAEFGVH